jgi:hypothetical protein
MEDNEQAFHESAGAFIDHQYELAATLAISDCRRRSWFVPTG